MTKPKPRGRLVLPSVITTTSEIAPNCEKYTCARATVEGFNQRGGSMRDGAIDARSVGLRTWRPFSLVWCDKPPTKILRVDVSDHVAELNAELQYPPFEPPSDGVVGADSAEPGKGRLSLSDRIGLARSGWPTFRPSMVCDADRMLSATSSPITVRKPKERVNWAPTRTCGCLMMTLSTGPHCSKYCRKLSCAQVTSGGNQGH